MFNETKYICLIVLAPDFMTKICKKVAQHFHCAVSKVFDRVKSVALWSANIRKLAKDHKGYGSAASYNYNFICCKICTVLYHFGRICLLL